MAHPAWRIDFPQGAAIRGTAAQLGQWPAAVNDQPANLRVLTLATSGEGAVLDDNTATIDAMLADYNAGIPTPAGSAESAGLCNVAAPLGAVPSRSAPAWMTLALGVLLARTRASARRRCQS